MILDRYRERQARRRQAHRDFEHDTSTLVNLSWQRGDSMTCAELAHRTGLPASAVDASLYRLLLRGWAVRRARTAPGPRPVPAEWFTWYLTDAGCTEAERRCGW